MKNLILTFGILCLSLSFTFAQVVGTWKGSIKQGKIVKTDQTPVTTKISGEIEFEITKTGDVITVTMKGLKSYWSAHRMTGRVGNGHLTCVLTNGDKSVYMMVGQIEGGYISGRFMYNRYGGPTSGIVPGWTTMEFSAKKVKK